MKQLRLDLPAVMGLRAWVRERLRGLELRQRARADRRRQRASHGPKPAGGGTPQMEMFPAE